MEKWALWIVNTLGFDGFRFDAVKHFSEDFLVELVDYLGANCNKNLFFVGNHPTVLRNVSDEKVNIGETISPP